MKAVLLADTDIDLYSTDIPPTEPLDSNTSFLGYNLAFFSMLTEISKSKDKVCSSVASFAVQKPFNLIDPMGLFLLLFPELLESSYSEIIAYASI
ncbi:protein FAM72A-like protein [Cricetulus griseus]|nr:protein FAM72A-like protein [Cricetulus griseus]